MLFCCSGNKTIKKDHKIHIFKLTCNFLFIMSTINKHGRDWKQGLIQILQYLEILILIQKYLVLRKFLVVKERESLNILWEIAVGTLTKGFDRWELINSFFFFFFYSKQEFFYDRSLVVIPSYFSFLVATFEKFAENLQIIRLSFVLFLLSCC